jgi:hypothetical protein
MQQSRLACFFPPRFPRHNTLNRAYLGHRFNFNKRAPGHLFLPLLLNTPVFR